MKKSAVSIAKGTDPEETGEMRENMERERQMFSEHVEKLRKEKEAKAK